MHNVSNPSDEGVAMSERRHFGYLRKRSSGRWQASYEYEGKRFTLGTYDRKADALTALAEVEINLRRGIWIDPGLGSATLSEYAYRWLEGRHNLAVRTRELYTYLLDRHILPELGQAPLRELTPADVRTWNGLAAKRHPSTAAKSYRLLATIMKTAVLDELIATSPCKVTGAGQEHTPERPVASLEEIDQLYREMPEHLRVTVVLAVWCQLRRGEILGLIRSDIDLDDMTLNVERSRTFKTTGESVLKEPKSAAGRRVVVIPSMVIEPLQTHLDRFVGEADDSLLVLGRDGEPASSMVIQRAWSKARLEVGRPDLHFHDLRHTGLTLAAATGATTAELMRRAGHASPAAALRYQHSSLERDRVIAERLSELSANHDQ